MTQANDHPDTPTDSAPDTRTPVPAMSMEIAATLMAARVLNYQAPPQTAPELPNMSSPRCRASFTGRARTTRSETA